VEITPDVGNFSTLIKFERCVVFRFCRAMRCIRAAMRSLSMCVCLSVCVSVTFVSCVKTNKDIFEFFSPSGSTSILVFPHQTEWRYSDGNPANGGVECRWGRQKTRFWTNIWLRCIQVYSVINRTSREVWKIKPGQTAASVEPSIHGGVRRPLFAQDDDEVFATGSTLYDGDVGQTPRTQPLWS